MDIDEIRRRTREEFASALAELQKTGEVNMSFRLIKADGSVTYVVAMPDVTNSKRAKIELGEYIRKQIAHDGVIAVIHISDTYFAKNITPQAAAIRRQFGLNIEEAHAMGLCEKREAVLAKIETPLFSMTLMQEYRRDGNRIELVGEPEDEESEIQPANLSGFWPREKARTA